MMCMRMIGFSAYLLTVTWNISGYIRIYVYIGKCFIYFISHKNYAVFLTSRQNKMPSFRKMHFRSLLLVSKTWLYRCQSVPLRTPGPTQGSVTLGECQEKALGTPQEAATLGSSSDRHCKVGLKQRPVNVNCKVENYRWYTGLPWTQFLLKSY